MRLTSSPTSEKLNLHAVRKNGYPHDAPSLFKFNLVTNSVFFRKLLSFDFLLGMTEFSSFDVSYSSKTRFSARCASAVHVTSESMTYLELRQLPLIILSRVGGDA